jgi:DNA repair protein RecN (Recombination protein N)
MERNMLSHLVIRNFAIIEHLEIAFHRGLTVLTGETGAGKSIVIDALNLLLGGRASTDVIRTSEDEAVVEGIFELGKQHASRVTALLEAEGIAPESHQLLVRRIISRSGRNKVFINGSLASVSTLGLVTRGLVDISGQHEHYSLIDEDRHLEILDNYGGLRRERDQVASDYDAVRRLLAEKRELENDMRDRLQRIDFLKYQLAEIDQAKLEEGEEARLNEEYLKLKNAEKIGGAVLGAAGHLYENEYSAGAAITESIELLRTVTTFDPSLTETIERLEEAKIIVHDTARELQYRDDIDADPHRLDAVQSRLEKLKRLRRKHARDIDELIAYGAEMRDELRRLEGAEERGDELDAELERARGVALESARKLSEKRQKVATRFSKAVEGELAALNMGRTTFVLDFQTHDENLGPRGIDQVTFRIAPNVGEEPKPLAKIASGGELSRIMLAIKSVLADRDDISTYIFDEVDSGISGETADRVGEKIAATAADHQVLCITHLPQIASRGDQHYLIAKTVVKGRTQSTLTPLELEGRVEEIARMLGGARVTPKTLEAARELIQRQ